ncbi:MAG TPA: DUF6498-containing protein [Candidatus Limnocylindrales bacterium]|nr:DUF6498-containing protein [Candidatus Limnocylindrales bacterium]
MSRLFTLQRAATASPVAIAALIAANAVPLVGVLAFGWDLATLVAIYWAENGVVGIYAVGRIITAANQGPFALVSRTPGSSDAPAPSTRYGAAGPPQPPAPPDPTTSAAGLAIDPAAAAGCAKLFMVPFFCLHYGIFWVVHGVFVWVALPTMFASSADGGVTGPDARIVLFAALVMVVSHGVSFIVNWIMGGEHLTSSPAAEMAAPYARVVVLHLTIIFGAFAVALIGQPIGALVVMVVLKTGVDLAAHLGERARAAGRARQAGIAPAT